MVIYIFLENRQCNQESYHFETFTLILSFLFFVKLIVDSSFPYLFFIPQPCVNWLVHITSYVSLITSNSATWPGQPFQLSSWSSSINAHMFVTVVKCSRYRGQSSVRWNIYILHCVGGRSVEWHGIWHGEKWLTEWMHAPWTAYCTYLYWVG